MVELGSLKLSVSFEIGFSGLTKLTIRFGLFDVERFGTVVDYENNLFLIIDKEGSIVDSFEYKF